MKRLALLILFTSSLVWGQNVVAVYHSGWDPNALPASGYNWNGITHLIWFGSNARTDGGFDFRNDGGETYLRAVIADAHAHGVKFILDVGDGATSSLDFITADSVRCENFVSMIMNNYVNNYGFDGVDVDWESSVSRWPMIMRFFRRALGVNGFLSSAIGRSYSSIWPAWAINAYTTYVWFMNYDMNGWYSCQSAFHNPLYDPTPNYPGMNSYGPKDFISTEITDFADNGVQLSKLIPGLALYPHIWHDTDVYQPNQATYSNYAWCNQTPNHCYEPHGWCEGLGGWNSSVLPWLQAGGVEHYDSLAAMAWIGSQSANGGHGFYANYNNAQSFQQKIPYILNRGCPGIMLFAQEHQYVNPAITWNGVLTHTPLMDDVRAALVPSPPTIITQPSNASAYVGATATFTVVASGTPPGYQWQENDVNIIGATASTYTTSALTVGKNGHTFRCIATNYLGSATSNEATLAVTNSAPIITSQPANRTIASGQTASFSVTAIGSLPLSYQWQVGGLNISGATNSAYTTSSTTLSDNGKVFRCVITNALGSDSSDNATLTISTPSVANPTSDDFSKAARFEGLWSKSHPSLTSLVGQGTNDALLRLNLDGTPHEMYSNDYNAVRVLQDIMNGSFEVVAKYQTLPSATYQWEGILVKENAASFLRFDILKDNAGLKFYAGKISASSQQKILVSITLSGPSVWVKVKRSGDVWTASYSSDGSVYTQAGQFTQSMVVDSIGVYAGNQNSGSGVPPFDCKVDYFFNVESPINPEDPVNGAPTGSLTTSSDTLPAGGGNVTLTWTSLDAISASIDQGIGNVALNGSTVVVVGQTKSFTLTLTNALGSRSYVAQVVVALPGGGGSLQDITSTGFPVALITNPTGTGNTNLEVMRDGITPPQGSSNPNEQYDTFNGGGTRLVDWIGYTYSSTQTFGSLIFQEGIHASNGGFFTASPKVEIRVGAQWIEVQGLTTTPTYTAGAAPNFATYTFTFNPMLGDGIRVSGTPGGSAQFLSVAELRVLGTSTSSVTPDNRPKDYDLLSNFPNPFNPSTTIEFSVPAASHVILSIYNILGQKVRTLVDQAMDNGKWPVTWDGRDEQNRLMSSGIYIYKLQAGDFVATRKMILSK